MNGVEEYVINNLILPELRKCIGAANKEANKIISELSGVIEESCKREKAEKQAIQRAIAGELTDPAGEQAALEKRIADYERDEQARATSERPRVTRMSSTGPSR
ncbi:MAG: hypothetical protein M0Z67_04195 [Nitrospiraceae bacterium]|nr:hypothetical protein [Nitrospiraceae bacterium]